MHCRQHDRKEGRATKEEMNWLPNMDLNHDKQIQRLLCYRYTIRQLNGTTR